MRRRIAPSPVSSAPVVSLWWDSTEVGGDHDDILASVTAEDEWGCITISLAERRPAAVQSVVYSERQRRLFLCTRWQRRIYAERVMRFERTVRRVREQVLFRRSREEEGVVSRGTENRRRRGQGIAVGARDRVPKAG